MLNISIIMDIRENAEKIAGFISADNARIQIFTDAKTLVADIEDENYYPDIVIIETIINKCNGVSIAAKIKQMAPNTQIVFAAVKHCSKLDVYDVDHIYTIHGEISEEKVNKALSHAQKKLDENNKTLFWYMKKGKRLSVPQSSILYFEKDKRLIRMYISDGRIEEFYGTMEWLLGLLSSSFVRCHNSYVVNLDYAAEYGSVTIRLRNGNDIPVSRAYIKIVKGCFENRFRVTSGNPRFFKCRDESVKSVHMRK